MVVHFLTVPISAGSNLLWLRNELQWVFYNLWNFKRGVHVRNGNGSVAVELFLNAFSHNSCLVHSSHKISFILLKAIDMKIEFKCFSVCHQQMWFLVFQISISNVLILWRWLPPHLTHSSIIKNYVCTFWSSGISVLLTAIHF